VCKGVRGGGGGVGVQGQHPWKLFFCLWKHVMYLGVFSAHGFCRWFSISS
jgi:hypothetical protein